MTFLANFYRNILLKIKNNDKIRNAGINIFIFSVFIFPQFASAESIFETTDYAGFISELWSLSVIIVIALSSIVILVGFILYVFGGSNKNNETLGKGLIEGGFFSIISIFFVRTVYYSFSKVLVRTTDPTVSQLVQTLNKIVTLISSFSYSIGVLVILYSGYLYLSSGGELEKIQKARKSFEYSVIGLVGIFLFQNIIQWIITFIN